ncbi:putative porin [uncultured Eudoraea sp.]|uniref:putative porin n=1 Tax=uncultured Eudoraea sp. TaxID=1035614 RepID=UPI00261A0D3A|nr:putative porin [uncultured Eudoraea sp.]
MRYLLLLILILLSHALSAQKDPVTPEGAKDTSLLRKKKSKRAIKKDSLGITIKDYKIVSYARDTTYLDTTLSIQKEYKYNFLRKDDFELMPFSNVGQPYNHLGLNFERNTLYPSLGANARHFNYMEVQDISYYNVATPMTDLFFKTTFEQGQLLDAMLTFNTSRRFNFSVAYKGGRSLGKYQWSQSKWGNFRSTANYVTKDGRYRLRAHWTSQELEGEENGGISNKELQFESKDPDFKDRSRIDVFFTDAENILIGKRYFLDHQYRFLKSETDSVRSKSNYLGIGHIFTYETKNYQFSQDSENEFFGDALVSPISDRANLKTMYNEINTEFSNRTLGVLKASISLYNYNYFFNSTVTTDEGFIPNRLTGEEIALGAKYNKQIGGFKIAADVAFNLVGDLTGNIINASASYQINEKNKISASLHSSSRLPDFNFLLYQSDYENYNWYNEPGFDKEQISSLQFNLESQVWGDLSAKYTTTDNYTYFRSLANDEQADTNLENAFIKPFQEEQSVNYLKVQYFKEFKFGDFALSNTLMYQNVSQNNEVLNLPTFLTRNTFYYSKHVFKKAMFLQTGITFKYFSSYNMDAYNPLLAEFYTQNREKLGGFPLLDFFVNAKVRTARIYLKAEHFNSSFTGNNFYAAPDYPYRDFVIRFGLVWNFFS